MFRFAMRLALVACLGLLASGASAQDYRARVQGQVVDESQGALPGVTVTLANDATGVSVDARHRRRRALPLRLRRSRHLHASPAELDGFKKAEQKNVRVQQRGDVTADLHAGDRRPRGDGHRRRRRRRWCSSTTSSTDLTLERQLIDQVPISGRNPYNLSNLDPTIVDTPATPNENRPYHHAYANDYDAGGGTRRANDVLLDGVRARRQLQDLLHAVDGRGRGDHRLEEQRGRRERQQPRRHHQPEHEVGHQHLQRDRRTASSATRA